MQVNKISEGSFELSRSKETRVTDNQETIPVSDQRENDTVELEEARKRQLDQLRQAELGLFEETMQTITKLPPRVRNNRTVLSAFAFASLLGCSTDIAEHSQQKPKVETSQLKTVEDSWKLSIDERDPEKQEIFYSLGSKMFSPEALEFFDSNEARVSFLATYSVPLEAVLSKAKYSVDQVSLSAEALPALKLGKRAFLSDMQLQYFVKMDDMSTGWQDNSIRADQFEDKYGNRIKIVVQSVQRMQVPTDSVDLDIELAPPIGEGPESGLHFVSVDLSQIGGPELKNIAVEEVLPKLPVTPVDSPYSFYTKLEFFDEAEHLLPPEVVAKMIESLSQVEMLFNLKPGTAIKGIYITDSKEANAFGNVARMIGMSSQEFNEKKFVRNLDLTLRHEAGHNIARYFQMDAYGGAQAQAPSASAHLYDRILYSPNGFEFFSKINEEQFIPGSVGGHSHGGPSELWTSFLSGLLESNWQKQIEKLKKSDQMRYLECLHEYLNILVVIPELKDSPIIDIFGQRIAVVTQMIQHPLSRSAQ